ncbi:MAG: TonB-dependent receptor [Myxococcota bacterium]
MTVLAIATAALAAAPSETSEPDEADEPVEVVVVTASRSETRLGDTPVAVEVLTRAAIEASGSETLAELLEERPGIQIEDTVVGSAVRLQGMNPEHTLILVDGQRVLGRKDGVVDLSRFTLDAIEQIEIVKGPSSALYGSDAMGGVIHIRTRRARPGVSAGLHMRSGTLARNDAAADLELGDERSRHRIGVGWHSGSAWDLDPGDPATTASAFQQIQAEITSTFRPAADASVDASASYLQRRLQGVDSTATGAVSDTRGAIEDARAAVGAWWTPDARTKVSARLSGSLYRAQHLSDQRRADANDSASTDTERLVESSVQLDRIEGDHALTLGVDGLAQGIDSDRLGSSKGSRRRIGVFAQDVWTAHSWEHGRLMVVPGARFDGDSQFGPAVTPRLAGALTARRVTVRLSAGTGYRAPDFRELYLLFENPGVGYVVAGNPDLRPEMSAQVNGSLELAPSERFSASAQVHGARIRDLIAIGTPEITGGTERFAYENIESAVTAGVDVQVRGRPGPVDLTLGYAALVTRDLGLDRPLEGRVPHRITGAAAVELPLALRARAQVGVASPRTFFVDADGDGTDEAVKTASQVTLDARASWKRDGVEVFAGVDNVLDTGSTELAPTTPRLLYAGLTLRTRRDR